MLKDVTVLIPAYNEAQTIADVVKTAAQLAQVIVVSDGSTDATAQNAAYAGAKVIVQEKNAGKGAALYTAVMACHTPYVLMLDADLLGLNVQHLKLLVQPVREGKYGMTIGVFRGGGKRTDFGNRATPYLSGQRACIRELLADTPRLKEERWPEPAINTHLKASGLSWTYIDLPNLKQVMKERKRGFWGGIVHRLKMYGELITYFFRRKR